MRSERRTISNRLCHARRRKRPSPRNWPLFTKTGKRPNIVWLVVDDMGYGDPGVYGGGAAIGAATPNIDRLGEHGPETDLDLFATDLHADPLGDDDRPPAAAHRPDPADPGRRQGKQNPWQGEESVAAILSEAGYHTVLTGKWHTGEARGHATRGGRF